MKLLGKGDKHTQQEQAKQLINSLDENQHKQLNDVLRDKTKLDALLKSPAAQQIINKMKSEDHGQH